MSGGDPEERPEENPKGRRHSTVVDFSSMYVEVRVFVDFRRRLIFGNSLSIFADVRCSSIIHRFSSKLDFRWFLLDLCRRSIFRRFSSTFDFRRFFYFRIRSILVDFTLTSVDVGSSSIFRRFSWTFDFRRIVVD